jgi:hypothetical protein
MIAGEQWYEPGPPVMTPALTLPPTVVRAPLVGDPVRELRRAGIAAAKLSVRRRYSFHGWLQTALLRKHVLSRCGCGLINCR